MSFLNKVKKGLGTAVDGAKIAGSMAVIKKDLEHAKLKKSKALKQLGEIVYNNKEGFADEALFTELFEEIEALDQDIEKFEKELSEEGKKFSTNDESVTEVVLEDAEKSVEAMEENNESVNQDKE